MTVAEVLVFLSGEGRNELGSRFGDPVYQTDDEPGVVQALLTRASATGWRVGGARTWKSIRKLRVGGGRHGDYHNVRGLALDAREAGCHALAFLRDRDNNHARVAAVAEGIESVEAEGGLVIVGAVVVPKLEGWMLALLGVHRTEALSPDAAESALNAKGVASKDGPAMVAIVERAALGAIPGDAVSLKAWLGAAERVLAPPT